MNHRRLEPPPPELLTQARSARTVLILTGAGMSAESGVPTFRDESAGLWAHYSPEAMATEEGWRTDPSLVWAWYLPKCGTFGPGTLGGPGRWRTSAAAPRCRHPEHR